jgi:putative transcriptional regulator
MESMKGKLLIASSRLGDPNFARAVLLMIQHNEDGALGLILNRPLETTLREACEQSLGESCEIEDVLYQGGPCEGPLMVVHTNELAKDTDVLPGIFFTAEKSKIETLLNEPSQTARFFVGYAGWSAGQLESELEIDSWLIAPAEVQHIFRGGENLWSKIMTQRMLGQEIDPATIPDDPSMN